MDIAAAAQAEVTAEEEVALQAVAEAPAEAEGDNLLTSKSITTFP